MKKKYPPHINAAYWSGQMRDCPKCSRSFISNGDQGKCACCGHVFLASTEYGLPANLSEAELNELNRIAGETNVDNTRDECNPP